MPRLSRRHVPPTDMQSSTHQPACRPQSHGCSLFVAGFVVGVAAFMAVWWLLPTPPATVNVWREVEPKVHFRDDADLPLPEPDETPTPAPMPVLREV